MTLTDKQIRYLKQQAHSLKPVVIVGQSGLSENVINEIDSSLEHHELLKVRINAADKQQRRGMLEEICQVIGAQAVQTVGHVATIYRRKRNGKPQIHLPG